MKNSDSFSVEQAYRTLFEKSLVGLVIFQGRRTVLANPAVAEIIGYTIEELLLLPPEEVGAIIHPNDRAWALERQNVPSLS